MVSIEEDFSYHECGHNEFKKEYETGEEYCSICGYIPYNPFSFNYVGLKQVKKEEGNTKLAPISNKRSGLIMVGTWDLEMQMIDIELKHGYKSRSYERFKKFKQRYYDTFETILLNKDYMLYEVPNIFYNHFRQWYNCNSKRIGNRSRVDTILLFLSEYEN